MIVPGPEILPSGKSLFGTFPLPSSPIVTTIGVPFLPGISTLVPLGYGDPSGFLGVTVTSPVSGSCCNSTVGVLRAGVSTVTFSTGLFGSVILAVPGVLPSGNSLFGTVPLPFRPISTLIGFPSLPGISTTVPGGYVSPPGFLGVTVTSPVFGFCSNSTVGVLSAGVVTFTGCDGFLFGSVTVPVPGLASFGKLSFGTVPDPSFPMVTSIVFPSSPGISTLVSGGYVPPPGFLGVTIASPFSLRVIAISVGASVSGNVGSIRFGVSTLTSSGSLPFSVIVPVPGVLSSGKLSFETFPLPPSSIVTTIGVPFLPGISTVVPGGKVVPSGFLGVTVTSPVFGSCSNSIVDGLRAGVVTFTGLDGALFGSVTIPLPGLSVFGSLSFGTVPEPSFPIITSIGVLSFPGIVTVVPGGYVPPPGFVGVTIASPFSLRVIPMFGV